ncbi:MAG: hypothetical protein ACOX2W_09575 [Desulfomonilia bacterium]
MSINTIFEFLAFLNEEGKALEYLEREGLGKLLSPHEQRYPPDYRDLARIHMIVRKRKIFNILEFGVGYSTIVMADALKKNKKDWNEYENEKPIVKKHAPFLIHSVDASDEYIRLTTEMIPESLKEYVVIHKSGVRAGTFQGRLCHYYDTLPDIIPDFIYLDGPHPSDVKNSIQGLSWNNPERTVMSADILLMEPTLTPGTIIFIDGRTNNARFLSAHLYRGWDIHKSTVEDDVTLLYLDEPPLGHLNRNQLLYSSNT